MPSPSALPVAVLPLVSVVMPSYNKGRYIADAIASLQAQTHPNWELLVVDDASTDDSVELLRRMAVVDVRIRLLAQPINQGANRCRNIGISEAQGEYLLFLDADDLLAPHCLAQRVRCMRTGQHHFAVFTMQVFQQRVGDSTHEWRPGGTGPLEDFFMHRLPWSIMQPIWRTGMLRALGGFDEAYRRHQDVDLHTRALLLPGVRYAMDPGGPDCYYRIAEERKTMDANSLLDGWTDAAVRYYFKFLEDARARGQASLLLGIILRNYLQVLYHFRKGLIDARQFAALEDKALDPRIISALPAVKRALLRGARTYNMQSVRIPGINRAIETLLVR